MKTCLHLTLFAFLILPTLAAAQEKPVWVTNPCLEGQPFTIRIPVKFQGSVEYAWYRNDTLIAGTLDTLAGSGAIAYTVPADKACGDLVIFHFMYRLNDGCEEWTHSPVYVVSFVPPQFSLITHVAGDTLVCASTVNSYSVASVAGVTYTWAVPAGWTITAGQGTNSIMVTAGSSGGGVSVTPSTACSNSAAHTLPVSIADCGPIPCTHLNTSGGFGISACSGISSAGSISGVSACGAITNAGTITVGQ